MAMVSPEISLQGYLKEVRLEKFEQSLSTLSVYSVSDLQEIDQSTLTSSVGMSLVHARRVIRTIRKMFSDSVSCIDRIYMKH